MGVGQAAALAEQLGVQAGMHGPHWEGDGGGQLHAGSIESVADDGCSTRLFSRQA